MKQPVICSWDEPLMAEPLKVHAQGGTVWLAPGPGGEAWSLPAPACRLIESFRRPQSAREAVRRHTQRAKDASEAASVVQSGLERGFLKPLSVWEARIRGNAAPASRPRLDYAVIPSGGRPELCAALVDALLANFNAHGTEAAPTVLQTGGGDYSGPLRQAARRHRRPVRLLTPEGTAQFIQRLAGYSGIDPALVAWALTDAGAPGRGLAYGAARNLALLACPAGHLLSLDDDVSCIGRLVADPSRCLANASGAWSSKSDLLPPPPPIPEPGALGPDFARDGAAWLGLNAGSCLAGNETIWQLEQCPGLARLLDPQARVRLIFSGTEGDSGVLSKVVFLRKTILQNGDWHTDPARFQAMFQSRGLARHFLQREVGKLHYCPGRVFWLDHSSMVPPNFPLGRGEDTLFAHMLAGIDGRFLAAYLPWSFAHRPRNPRDPHAPLREDPLHLFYGHRLSLHLVGTLVPLASAYSGLPMDQALSLTGSELRQRMRSHAARVPAERLDQARALVSAQIRHCEELIEHTPGTHPRVAADLAWLIRQWQDILLDDSRLLPHDIQEIDPRGDWETLRHWLLRYAELLQAWPVLHRAACAIEPESCGMTVLE